MLPENVCIIEPDCQTWHNAKSDTISVTNDPPLTEKPSFGEWLRKQRRAQDLTRQTLAAQAGCAEITLRRIENGTLKPSQELARILLEKLGIPEAERPQWILFARGLSGSPAAPLDSLSRQPLTNLPAPLTTFIGREKERAEIIKHIKKHRLVTLTGPGGVGKTGLSFSVGERVGGDYANGIWLVELAALTGPVLLPQAVVAVLGLTAQTNTSSTALLIDYLRPKTILLILDNCEHLLEASAKLADTLLKNCPGLKILATSRETLQIPGEATYRDPSLEVPSLKQLPDPLSGYDSVRLFEERAQLAQPDFSLTSGNISAIAQICGQLDGIPLAIELAAAQVNRFSTEQIAAKLTESFNVLTGGSRTVLPHQQTLRASIEWSWALLSAPERSLLQRLSIFRGGWSLEAAETVCGVSAFQPKEDKESSRQQSESLDLFDSLTQLVNKSLVAVESHTETRYRILETIRQYAGEKLLSSGDGEATRNRHLHFYLGFAEHANAKLRSADQQTWQNRLQVEPDNCRAAQGWAPVSGQLTSVSAGYGR